MDRGGWAAFGNGLVGGLNAGFSIGDALNERKQRKAWERLVDGLPDGGGPGGEAGGGGVGTPSVDLSPISPAPGAGSVAVPTTGGDAGNPSTATGAQNLASMDSFVADGISQFDNAVAAREATALSTLANYARIGMERFPQKLFESRMNEDYGSDAVMAQRLALQYLNKANGSSIQNIIVNEDGSATLWVPVQELNDNMNPVVGADGKPKMTLHPQIVPAETLNKAFKASGIDMQFDGATKTYMSRKDYDLSWTAWAKEIGKDALKAMNYKQGMEAYANWRKERIANQRYSESIGLRRDEFEYSRRKDAEEAEKREAEKAAYESAWKRDYRRRNPDAADEEVDDAFILRGGGGSGKSGAGQAGAAEISIKDLPALLELYADDPDKLAEIRESVASQYNLGRDEDDLFSSQPGEGAPKGGTGTAATSATPAKGPAPGGASSEPEDIYSTGEYWETHRQKLKDLQKAVKRANGTWFSASMVGAPGDAIDALKERQAELEAYENSAEAKNAEWLHRLEEAAAKAQRDYNSAENRKDVSSERKEKLKKAAQEAGGEYRAALEAIRNPVRGSRGH